MNILFISAVLPYPLHSGGQVRIYNILKELGKKHSITLCSFIRSEKERTFENQFPFLDSVHMVMRGRVFQPRYILKALFGSHSLLTSSYDNQMMRDRISTELSKGSYDLIHIEPFYVYPSVGNTHIPLVVGEHNIEYRVYEAYAKRAPSFFRPLFFWDITKMKTEEETVWKKASQIIAVSKKDASIIESERSAEVSVVSNGVDTQYFSYKKYSADPGHPRLLFVGNFAWIPNRDAVKRLTGDIWPGIKKALPGAILHVVGKNLPPSMQKKIEGIEYRPFVDDIRKEFHWAHALVSPIMISGGTKFKILEAFASGLPVVATVASVWGLPARDGREYREAQSSAEFVRAVQSLYNKTLDWPHVTRSARRLVEKEYSWKTIAEKLDSVWKKSV